MSLYKHFTCRGHVGVNAIFVLLFLVGFYFSFFLKPVSAETRAGRIQLTSEEQERLREHPIMRLAPGFSYAVFTAAPIANAQTWSAAKRQIVAGGDFNYPPYEWIDEYGQPAGFNVEIMRAIAEAMGWEVTFQLGTWEDVRKNLATGKIDVLPMYSSEERFEVVDFTDPFEMIYYEVFIRRGAQPVLSLDKIRGLEVIVQRDALMHDHLKQNDRGALLVLVESEPDALRLLASGRYDCAIVSRIGGLYAIDRLKLKNLATSGEPLLPREYALAVRKGNIQLRDQLNQGLSIIKKTGRHEEISRKWFGEKVPPGITLWSVLRYVMWILVPLIFLAAAAFVWAEMLKKKVAKKTQELSIELDERTKAEDTLRESEEKYRTLVENIPQKIFTKDKHSVYVSCNNNFASDLGITPEEFAGKTDYDFFPKELADKYRADDMRVMESGETEYIEEQYMHNGETVWVYTVKTPIRNKDGNTVGILGVFSDITERKRVEEKLRESEERLRLVMDGLGPQMFVGLMDKEGVVLMANKPAMEVAGLRPEDVYGKHCPETYWFVYSDAVRQRMSAAIQRAAQGETVRYDEQIRVAENQLIWLDLTLQPLRDESGKIVFLIPSAIVITERKRAEEELNNYRKHLEEMVKERTAELQNSQLALMNLLEDLNQKTTELGAANEKLKEVDRLKSIFIASMSHELRTPLNSVIGFSSILLNEWLGTLNQVQKENLAAILKSGKHLLALINDVIDISKIEAGKIDVRYEDFDLNDLILDVVKIFQKDAREKRLELNIDAPHQLMHTDKRRLLQCILNLLSNAVKFTEKGSVSIIVRLTDNDDLIEISVEDTGIGIKKEDLPKFFKPFVRIETHLTAKVSGTGLGLYLTKKLVTEVLKGDIIIKSTYEKGSTFTIRIPVKISE